MLTAKLGCLQDTVRLRGLRVVVLLSTVDRACGQSETESVVVLAAAALGVILLCQSIFLIVCVRVSEVSGTSRSPACQAVSGL